MTITLERQISDRIILVIIDHSFGFGRQKQQPLLPVRDLPPESAPGERKRSLALRFRLGLDQVGKTFGLGEIDTAVLEGAPSELPGFCGAQVLDTCQSL